VEFEKWVKFWSNPNYLFGDKGYHWTAWRALSNRDQKKIRTIAMKMHEKGLTGLDMVNKKYSSSP
jgi:hypothetical protein